MMLVLLCINLMFSCGPKSLHLNSNEDAEILKNRVLEVAGEDLPVYRIIFTSTEELETLFRLASLYYVKEDTFKVRDCDLFDGKMIEDKPEREISSKIASARPFNNQPPEKISEIDFNSMTENLRKAIEQIPVGYKYAGLSSYDYKRRNGKRADRFRINVTRMGEAPKRQNRRNWITNYYPLEFYINEKGELIKDE